MRQPPQYLQALHIWSRTYQGEYKQCHYQQVLCSYNMTAFNSELLSDGNPHFSNNGMVKQLVSVEFWSHSFPHIRLVIGRLDSSPIKRSEALLFLKCPLQLNSEDYPVHTIVLKFQNRGEALDFGHSGHFDEMIVTQSRRIYLKMAG